MKNWEKKLYKERMQRIKRWVPRDMVEEWYKEEYKKENEYESVWEAYQKTPGYWLSRVFVVIRAFIVCGVTGLLIATPIGGFLTLVGSPHAWHVFIFILILLTVGGVVFGILKGEDEVRTL